MIRRCLAIVTLALLLVPIILACTEQRNIRVNKRLSFSEVKLKTDRYPKRAAIVLKNTAATLFVRQIENLYIESLNNVMRDKSNGIVFETVQDQQVPEFLQSPDLLTTVQSRISVLNTARRNGYFAIVEGSVVNVSSDEKTNGIFMFRKVRYYLTITLSLNVYNPVTSAKYASLVRSKTVKIELGQYNNFTKGSSMAIAELDDAVVDLSDTLAKEAIDAIAENPWMASIVQVQDGRALLGPGSASGLSKGDRLVVFEGRQKEQGPDGMIYITPGYKLAEIQISGFTGTHALASVPPDVDLQPGDIVVAVDE